MEIAVCIKQVPDTAEVKVNPETNTLVREGVPSIINPYDLHAVEAALWLKAQLGGSVTAITMGPPQAESALREVISMGCDNAVLLTDRAFAGSDTLATSYTLSMAIKKIGAAIIVCGKQAIDGDTAQVGPELAQFLNIPHVSYVRKIEEATETGLKLQRLMDDGYDVIEAEIPVLLTVVRELNEPRLPSLKGKMAARKAEIKMWTAKDIGAREAKLGLAGSPTQVKRIFAPEAIKDRKMLEGPVHEQVDAVIEALKGLKCL